jgi:hypothetical protein
MKLSFVKDKNYFQRVNTSHIYHRFLRYTGENKISFFFKNFLAQFSQISDYFLKWFSNVMY